MSNTQMASATTGYLTSFAATYQIEGVTEEQAARIAAEVKTALEAAFANLAAEAATTAATPDARVLEVRVERRGFLVEEYER